MTSSHRCCRCVVASPLVRTAASRVEPQPRRRSRRSACSAAPKSKSRSAAAGWPTPRRCCSTRPASTVDEARSRRATTRSRPTLTIAPDCRLGIHALRVRTATGISNLRTFSVGALAGSRQKSSRTTSSPSRKPIAAERHRQRRRRQRGRRLLRRRSQEGRAAHRRGRRHAAGQHVLRSLRRDSRTQAGSSWPAATTRPCCSRTACARSSLPRTASTSSRSAKAAYGGNGGCTIGCTSATSRGPPRSSRRRQAGRNARRALDRRCQRAISRSQVTLPTDGRARCRPRRPGCAAASPLRPMSFRVIDLRERPRSRAERRLAKAATPARRPLAAQRRHRASRATSTSSSSRPRRGRQFDVRVLCPQAAALAARCGADDSQRQRRRRSASNDDTRRPGQLPALQRPGRRRIRRLGPRSARSNGGPDYVYRVEITPVEADARRLALPERQQYIPTTLDVPQGQSHGADGQRPAAEFRRRPDARARRTCRRA